MSAELPAGHTLARIGDEKWAKGEFFSSKKGQSNKTLQEMMSVVPEEKPDDKTEQKVGDEPEKAQHGLRVAEMLEALTTKEEPEPEENDRDS